MYHKQYEKLEFKMIAMTLGFSLIPLVILGTTIYYQFNYAFQNKIIESLRMLLQDRKSSIELYFNERISQLNIIAQTHSFQTLKDENFLTKIFDAMQSRSQSFVDLSVIDSDGNHVAYVGPYHERLRSVNYADEEWFHAVQSTGIYISDLFLGFRNIPHFIIAVSRVEKNCVWILRTTINAVILNEIVGWSQLGERGDAFIINRQNILQTPARFAGKPLEHPNDPDFSSWHGSTVQLMDFKGDKSLFGVTSLSSPQMGTSSKGTP